MIRVFGSFATPNKNITRLMKTYSWLAIFTLLISFSSCTTKKSLAGGKHGGDAGSNTSLDDKTFHLLEKTQVPYTWFAGSGQGKIDWDGERYTVRFNVRILHDSI